MSGVESDEFKRYQKLLKLNIELLCQQKPNEVMNHIKKKWYPTQSCLEICKAQGHKEAVAFLLKRSGSFAESLNAYIEILASIREKMKNPKNNHVECKKEFTKYFECALKVCKKQAKIARSEESEQGLWFVLLDTLYEMWQGLFKEKNEAILLPAREQQAKNSLLDKVGNIINDCIKTLIGSMMETVSFPTILTRVTERHGDLEIESFKELFTNMLLSYFYQEKILETAKNILGNNVVKQFNSLATIKKKGVFLKTTICSKCKKSVTSKPETEAITFSCGHIYHSECLKNKTGCDICLFQERSIFENN